MGCTRSERSPVNWFFSVSISYARARPKPEEQPDTKATIAISLLNDSRRCGWLLSMAQRLLRNGIRREICGDAAV